MIAVDPSNRYSNEAERADYDIYVDFFFFFFFFNDKTIGYSDYYKTCNIGKKTYIIMIVKRHNYTLKNTGIIEPVSVQCKRTKNQHRPSTSHIYQTREV